MFPGFGGWTPAERLLCHRLQTDTTAKRLVATSVPEDRDLKLSDLHVQKHETRIAVLI